jgi:hypothetical protein
MCVKMVKSLILYKSNEIFERTGKNKLYGMLQIEG